MFSCSLVGFGNLYVRVDVSPGIHSFFLPRAALPPLMVNVYIRRYPPFPAPKIEQTQR